MIVSRLLHFIEYKGISKRKFYLQTGLSNGFLDKVKDIGVNKVENILSSYPEINPIWLLTGEGEMLKKDTPIYNVSEKKVNYSNQKDCKEIKLENTYLKKEIENLKDQAKLKDQIIELLQEKTRQSIHKKPTHTQR